MPTRQVTFVGLMTWADEADAPHPSHPIMLPGMPGWGQIPGFSGPGGGLPIGPGHPDYPVRPHPIPTPPGGWPYPSHPIMLPGMPGWGQIPGFSGPGGGLPIWPGHPDYPTRPTPAPTPPGGWDAWAPPPPPTTEIPGIANPIAGQPLPGGAFMWMWSPVLGWVLVPTGEAPSLPPTEPPPTEPPPEE